jgi:chorismate mutase-like protein
MSNNDLDQLRRQIDEIDDALHDLLQKRMQVVELVGQAKGAAAGKTLAMRPGREAVVMRRLLAQHKGRFPPAALIRMWREMMGAVTGLQGPFAVAVCVPDDQRGFWDMARDHFGVQVPMRRHSSTKQVLADITDNPGVVGLLPLPGEADKDPWWPSIVGDLASTPNVVARVPFVRMGNSRTEGLSGVLVAQLKPEPSGPEALDRSLLVLESPTDVSRSRISMALQAAKLPAFTSSIRHNPEGGGVAYLIELPGFMIDGDARLKALEDAVATKGARLTPIGCYAVPADLQSA